MSASSLVLSSLLSLPCTVHLPATVQSRQYLIGTDETGTQEHSFANFYSHYYHYHYYHYYYYHYHSLFTVPSPELELVLRPVRDHEEGGARQEVEGHGGDLSRVLVTVLDRQPAGHHVAVVDGLHLVHVVALNPE